MTRLNLFEGSRRIVLLLKIIWVVGVTIVTYTATPSVYLHFTTQSPTDTFHVGKDDCQIGTDGVEFLVLMLEDGKPISIQLCFKSWCGSGDCACVLSACVAWCCLVRISKRSGAVRRPFALSCAASS